MSACLKTLYTTTKRSNGVAKITALDQELCVWKNSISNLRNRGSTSDNAHGLAEGDYVDPSYHTFEIQFLYLLSNVCMLLIHQPALTFDRRHPQFIKSLSSCVRSGLNILSILKRNQNDKRLNYLLPNRASLVFQSALICFYHRWVSFSSVQKSTSGIDIPLGKITECATELLKAQQAISRNLEACPLGDLNQETLSSATAQLQFLCSRTQELHEEHGFFIPEANGQPQLQSRSFLEDELSSFCDPGIGMDDLPSLEALSELNHMDFGAWDDDLLNFQME